MTNFNRRSRNIQTATFSMGCFWGPDSRFGHLPGVIRTRVGYAGGTTPDPTYKLLGDHTETLEIDFDPEVISYSEILTLFWDNHDAAKDRNYKGRQYLSLLFYHNVEQQQTLQQVKQDWENNNQKNIQTEIQPYSTFYRAEDRHQKYFLKRYPKALEAITSLFPTYYHYVDSTIAARLNGFVREYGLLADIKKELEFWELTENEKNILIDLLHTIRW